MGSCIVKLDGRYLIWSSIVDSFTTFGLTREELFDVVREEEGRRGVDALAARLARADTKGTSAFDDKNVDDSIWLNRAGPGGIPLSKSEIIEWYVRRKRYPTRAEIDAHRATLPKCDPCIYDHGDGTGSMCPCWGSGVRETLAPVSPSPHERQPK